MTSARRSVINRLAMFGSLACWLAAFVIGVLGMQFVSKNSDGWYEASELFAAQDRVQTLVGYVALAGIVLSVIANFTARGPVWLIAALGNLAAWLSVILLFVTFATVPMAEIGRDPRGMALYITVVVGFLLGFTPQVVRWRRKLRAP